MASWFGNLFSTKESAVARAIAQQYGGSMTAKFTPRRYDSFAKEGYVKNVIAFRCISLIAQSAASVPWQVYKGDQLIKGKNPLDDILRKPNLRDSLPALIEGIASYYAVAGNAYIERTTSARGEPLELFNLRPDRMKIKVASDGEIGAYVHTVGGQEHNFEVDASTGESNILHIKHFNPLDDWYGMAPIEAAAYSVDQHNFAGEHNAALLQNGATPNGLLLIKQEISEEMLDRAEKKMHERFGSAKNSGKTMVLGGDMDYKRMAQTNRELDFDEGKRALAREICAAFGVPHELVVMGDSTYNNKAEARLFLWEEKVIPFLDLLQGSLMEWLARPYGDGLQVRYELDDVSALSIKREQRRRSIVDMYVSGLLTRNETRAELGFADSNNGDNFANDTAPAAAEEKKGLENAVEYEQSRETKASEDMYAIIQDEIDQPEIAVAVSQLVRSELDKVVQKYGEAIVGEIGLRSSFEVTDEVVRFSENTTATMLSNVNRTTKRLVRNEIQEAFLAREKLPQIRERIKQVFKGQVADVRAKRIAETEVTKLTGFSAHEAIKQSGIQKKEWLSTLDGSTRDSHVALDGTIIDVDAKFRTINGDEGLYAGDFSTASENINCRCSVAAVFDGKSMDAPEKRELWHKREKQREGFDKSFMEVSLKMFTMQLEVIDKRLTELSPDE